MYTVDVRKMSTKTLTIILKKLRNMPQGTEYDLKAYRAMTAELLVRSSK
tara:strand:+ start:491 stop:637 length:147 start_codon:yes stop_codon:yes gene_type:complete